MRGEVESPYTKTELLEQKLPLVQALRPTVRTALPPSTSASHNHLHTFNVQRCCNKYWSIPPAIRLELIPSYRYCAPQSTSASMPACAASFSAVLELSISASSLRSFSWRRDSCIAARVPSTSLGLRTS